MWKTKNSQVEEKGDRSEQRNWPLLNPRGALVSKAPIKSAPSTSGLSGGLHTATKDSVLFSKAVPSAYLNHENFLGHPKAELMTIIERHIKLACLL